MSLKVGDTACNVCGGFHFPHCISTTIPAFQPAALVIPIDWNRVRIDAAIAAMQAILTNSVSYEGPTGLYKIAVEHADALIAELKKEPK